MKYCDLHTHTTASDGSDSPAEVIQLAVKSGLAAIAVTDHDTVAGLPEALEASEKLGIEILPGVELSVQIPHGTLHVLAYLFNPSSPALKEVLKEVQSARATRNPLILERLKDLGRPISQSELEEMGKGGQIGRPHIARAMVNRGYVKSTNEAFSRYLKKGASAYIPKSILSPERAITTIHKAGGLAVLAHPMSLEFGTPIHLDELVAKWTEQGLDGIECYYSMHSKELTNLSLSLCKKYDLVPTGGSDYHGKAKPKIMLGRGTGGLRVPYSCVEALRERWNKGRRLKAEGSGLSVISPYHISQLRSFHLLLFLVFFLSLFPFSLPPSAFHLSYASEPDYGDAIVLGSIGDATTLIPMLASDATSHQIAGLIYNGLVKYDKDLNLVGDLAESWAISSDGLTITFKLRKGVKWEDGEPFTSRDVLFGFETITAPGTPTAYAGDFLEVENAEAPDPYTFKVTYREPFAPALSSWGNLVVLPKHLLDGKDITKSTLGRNPVGLGPYSLSEWKTQERIELKANPTCFEGRPYLNRYIMRIIPDPATMFLELKSGGLDWMGLSPIQYERQANTLFFEINFNKYRYLSFSYTYLGYNLKFSLFTDKRVRQAIAYAIDKDEIIRGVLLGYGVKATGPYKPDTWFYNSDVRRYPYDPKRAIALLVEAGWVDRDGDGWLDKEGRPFSFTAITNQGNPLRDRTAQIIQYRLKQIGIEMKIRTLEWTAFINDFIDKRRFEAVMLGWTLGQDPDIYDIWHSSKTGGKELNFISYQNPEMDRLLVEGRRTFDRNERKKIYWRIQEILAEDQPYTFLYVPMALPVIHKRFKGIEPAPAGITYNFIRWWVPKYEQKYIMP